MLLPDPLEVDGVHKEHHLFMTDIVQNSGILLFVCSLTHELIVGIADGLAKSSAPTRASKYCLLS